jgi:hypothetical protein
VERRVLVKLGLVDPFLKCNGKLKQSENLSKSGYQTGRRSFTTNEGPNIGKVI